MTVAAAHSRTVLVVMPLGEQRGGGELMLWNLMEHGRNAGVRWIVAFFEPGPMVEAVTGLGIETHIVPSGRLRQPHRLIGCILRLASLARTSQTDLILSWMSKPHLYGSIAGAIAGVPTCWYQLGVPRERDWVDRIATLLPARGILTCSRAGAAAQGRLFPRRPMRVVYPGVELSRFDPRHLPSPAVCRAQLGLPPDGPLIGIVGRLQHWKGMHVLIEAMPAILATYPSAHCVIVGGAHDLEPSYPDLLRQKIEELKLTDRVLLTGIQRNVPEWMQAMDVIVHASDREPFGIVVIEAMALGKPVVATNTAGPTEVITPSINGSLTPFGDPHALSCAILNYLSNPSSAAAQGAAARQRAGDFSTQQYATNLIQSLNQFIQSA